MRRSGSAGGPPVRLAVIEHEAGTDVRRLGDWLRAAGAVLTIFRPYRQGSGAGSAPGRLPRAGEFEGLIVLGGSMGPGDDTAHPWLPGTRSLLRASAAGEFPSLAVCLGGELLAQATGGRIEQSVRPQAGLAALRRRAEAQGDPVFGGLPAEFPAYLWHSLQMTLPPGARHLAEGGEAPIQAFRLGEAWGTQFHPESTGEQLRGWGSDPGSFVADNGRGLEDITDEATAAESTVAAVMEPVAQAFVRHVRDFAQRSTTP